MVITRRASVCATAGFVTLLLATSGCGGSSDKSDSSAGSSKSSKSASATASPSSAASARPVKAYCLPDKNVSQRLGAQFVAAGQPKLANGAVECDYLGGGPTKSVLIYTAQNFAPGGAAQAFHSSMAIYKRALAQKGVDFDLENKGLDAGIGAGSKYIERPTGLAVIAYDSNGTVVFAQLNSKKAHTLKTGLFATTGTALDVY
jgi:hypothetical protein